MAATRSWLRYNNRIMPVLRARKGKYAGSVFPVYNCKQPTVIGRDPGIDVELDDGRTSRRHARVLRAYGTWYIEDLGSSNGTLVNQKRVQRARIEDGALVQIGATLLSFHDTELPPPPREDVFGARVKEVKREECAVFTCTAFQAALDREVRVDLLAPHRGQRDQVFASVRQAVDDARKLGHPLIDALIHAEVEPPDDCHVILRSRYSVPLSARLQDVLAMSLSTRLRLFRELVEVLLTRAVWEGLRSPVGLEHIHVATSERGTLEVCVPAVEISALIAERTDNLRHVPSYVPYLPPELTEKREQPDPVDFRSTMYVLGAIGYHLLAGRPPMGDGSVQEILKHHRTLDPTPPVLLQTDLPAEVSDLLLRMLSKATDGRPSGRLEVVEALERAQEKLTVADVRAAPSVRQSRVARTTTRVGVDPPSYRPAAPSGSPSRRVRRRSFLGSAMSLPLWLVLWALTFCGARYLAEMFFLRN